MNTPDNVTLPTPKSNPMPKVFPKKEIASQRVLVREPAIPPKIVQPAGPSRVTAPAEGTRLNAQKGRAAIPSRPVSNERPQESNAVNTRRVSLIAGTATVHFECIAPQAKAVFVAGNFNEWNPEAVALARSAEGKWTVDLALRPGRYEYLFVVDGRWTCDVATSDYVPNLFGGCNSVVTVSSRSD